MRCNIKRIFIKPFFFIRISILNPYIRNQMFNHLATYFKISQLLKLIIEFIKNLLVQHFFECGFSTLITSTKSPS
jgi:hypothetical protein